MTFCTFTGDLRICTISPEKLRRGNASTVNVAAWPARSRYLFIAMHRKRFGDKILAELRGVIDERGGSPFWDGVAGRFFIDIVRVTYGCNGLGNMPLRIMAARHKVLVQQRAD